MGIQSEILADLHSMSEHIRCEPVGGPEPPPGPARRAVGGHRAGRDRLRAARADRRRASTSQPASERVLRNFTLDPNDPKRLTAAVPPGGFELVLRNESWLLYSTCHMYDTATG